MIFASDNWAGASPKVVDAVAEAARRSHPANGDDEITRAVERRFSELFEHEVAVFLVGSGTAANAIGLSAFARPGGIVFCHRGAHITVDEAGATEFFGGGLKVVGIDSDAGRIDAGALRDTLRRYPDGSVHHGQPVAVSLTQITEWGTAYRPEQIAALSAVARERGCAVHMDGARFANAVAGLGVAPADITWRAGVDVLSFGGTKNGCLAAEAVVFFARDRARDVGFARKRAGQSFSKNWFVAAQFAAYLDGGHWLELAGHANAMASRLAEAIRRSNSARLAVEREGNELFVILPEEADRRLRAAGATYHPWSTDGLSEAQRPGQGEVLVRLIASWQTTPEEIDRFAAVLAET